MTETSLSDELITLITNNSNNNPAPIPCEVIKNYQGDNYHIDVKTDNGILEFVPCLFNNTIGKKGMIVFLNGDINSPIAIIDVR